MADNPSDFAYVPDKKTPSSWKLNISDATHIADAITALTSGFRGNKVEIPSKDKKVVVSKIRGAINKLSDKDQKANLLQRLATVKEVEKAFTGKLEPEDVNYIPLSTTKGEACANCRWFIADAPSEYACFIVAASDADDEPILATGICDRWEANPEPAEDPMEEMVETLVEALSENADTISDAVSAASIVPDMSKAKKSLAQRIKDLFVPKPTDDAFMVFKGADGKDYWHAIYTNNFEDREGEILTEHGHDAYIERLDMGLVPMPVLRAWHVVGSEHGQADSVWRNGHFVHAVGHFNETPEAQKAVKFYQKNTGKIKMSHGFIHPDWAFDGKHYDEFNTIEITTLPPYAAANPYTSFEELKEMALTEEKRRYLEQVVGKDKLAEIEAKDGERSKALEDMKVAYKDFVQVTPPTTPAVTPEAQKALSVVYGDLNTTVDEIMGVIQLQHKAIESKDVLIAQLKTEKDSEVKQLVDQIKELRTLVNAPPQRPSQSQSTVVDPTKTTLKDALPQKPDDFFGADFFVPTPNPAGANQ